MFHGGLQIFHVLGRESILIQSRRDHVDLLDRPAQIGHECAAFPCKIVNASFTRTTDVGIWRQKSLRLTGRHRHVYESVAKQTGTSDSEFTSFRDLNVIINLQRYIHALAFANHSWTARDFSDLRAREQDIRTFQQPARVAEPDGERIISSKAFAKATELHDQRA